MRIALAPLLLIAAPLAADPQPISPNVDLTPEQIGHVFAHACLGSRPVFMERNAEPMMEGLGWEPADLGADAGWIGPGDITLTVDGNPLETSCTMSMHPDLAGDGAELYDALAAHLREHLDGTLPEGQALDATLRFAYSERDTDFTLDFFMGEAVSLTLTGTSQ